MQIPEGYLEGEIRRWLLYRKYDEENMGSPDEGAYGS